MPTPSRIAPLLALALAASLPGAARAGINGAIETGYQALDSHTTDQAQRTEVVQNAQLLQRYRLNLNHQLFPKLTFRLGGTLEQTMLWRSLTPSGDSDPAMLWNANSQLVWTDPIFGAGAGYAIRTVGAGRPGATVLAETPSLQLSWRPVGLPTASLRVERRDVHDPDRVHTDRVTNQATLGSSWTPIPAVSLGYGATYIRPENRITGTETQTFLQSGRVSWMGRFFGDRTTVSTAFNLAQRNSQVVRAGLGGTVEQLQPALTGLSAVEDLPFTTTDIPLAVNGALVDGASATAAGVNLGFALSLAGDSRPRHVGGEFADPLTRVNRVLVYVDRELPPGVSGGFTWTAYRSLDNRAWQQVPLAGVVTFDTLLNRFEIPIEQVESRYVKVVTRPLDPGVTIDAAFREIQVTELQFLQLDAAPAARDWTSLTDAMATASAQTRLTPELSHDISLQGALGGGSTLPVRTGYLISNGLTYDRPLGEKLRFTARGSRQDNSFGRGHTGIFLYSAALAANLLPTWGHVFTYTGQHHTSPLGTQINNNLAVLTRLTPYRGIGLFSNVSYSLDRDVLGRLVGSELITLSATFQPHPRLSLATTGTHLGSNVFSGEGRGARTWQDRVDGSVSFSPFNSLYLAGTLTYAVIDSQPVTLGNASVAFSPFSGGALQFGLNYTQNITTSGVLAQYFSPSLRWTIRRGLIFSTAYSLYHSGNTIPKNWSQTFNANFQILL